MASITPDLPGLADTGAPHTQPPTTIANAVAAGTTTPRLTGRLLSAFAARTAVRRRWPWVNYTQTESQYVQGGHVSAEETAGDLHAQIKDRLRRVDQRYTAGRQAIVEVLVNAGHPVSIDDIAKLLPNLPRSSAYR